MSYYLFLDDIRIPKDAFDYTNLPMFIEKDWVIVRNYDEFVNHIQSNGLPLVVSFDHDLSDLHYSSAMYKGLEEYNKIAETFTEKTGYDCALWLVDYCMDNQLKCPDYYCHSMNPVGKEKINSLLYQFKYLEL